MQKQKTEKKDKQEENIDKYEKGEISKEKIVINAENAILGRLASYSAKQALRGKEIIIVNSEKAIIMGKKENIIEGYLAKRRRTGSLQRGPKFPSNAERILKRTIRGMLSYKRGKGSDAFDRIMCYNGVPREYENAKKIATGKKKDRDFLTLKQIARFLKAGR